MRDVQNMLAFLKHCQLFARLRRVPSFAARLIDALGQRLLRSWAPGGDAIGDEELGLWVTAIESCRSPEAQEAALARAMAFAPAAEPESPASPSPNPPEDDQAPGDASTAKSKTDRARGKGKAVPRARASTAGTASDSGPDYEVHVAVSLLVIPPSVPLIAI